MLEALFWLAAALAFAGGCAGNRMAWPLLASFAFCQAARWQGWPFDEYLWATVDLVTLLMIAFVIAWRAIGAHDWSVSDSESAIVLLFALILGSYGLEGWTRYYLSNGVNIAQLILAFPWNEFRPYLHQPSIRKQRDLWKDFDLSVSA